MIFGNDTIEESTGQLSGSILGLVASSGDAGNIASITAYLTPTGTRKVKYALYRASDDALLGVTEEISISSAGWHTANFSSVVAIDASTSYYILAIADGSFQCTIARASESSKGRYKAQSYESGFPDPSGTANNNFRYSIYATYEESGPVEKNIAETGKGEESIFISITNNRYWVGGSGNWSDNTNHWSDVSGGTPGASLPTATDNVFFDANSGAGAVAINETANCLNFDASTASVSEFSGANNINVHGNFNLKSGLTWSATGVISFLAVATGKTITTNSVAIYGSINFNGAGGGWTLQDSLTVNGASGLNLTLGTLDTNDKAVTVDKSFVITGTGVRGLTLGTSAIACDSWNAGTTTNLTFDAEQSTITITGGASNYFITGGKTYYNLIWDTSAKGCYISGSATFNNITVNAGKWFGVNNGVVLTVTSFTADGDSSNWIEIYPYNTGNLFTITCASNVSINYVHITGCTGNGGGTFTNDNGIDGGRNTNWTFTNEVLDRFWVKGTGNWNDADGWALTSGGIPNSLFIPTYKTDAIFDANSFSGASQVVTITLTGADRFCKDLDFTNATNSPTLTLTGTSYYLKIYGNLKLIDAMTVSNASWSKVSFYGTESGKTIDSAGLDLSTWGVYIIDDGEWTLLNDFDIRFIYIYGGTFNTDGYDMSGNYFSFEGDVLTLGDSVITINDDGGGYAELDMYMGGSEVDFGTSKFSFTASCTDCYFDINGGASGQPEFYDVEFLATTGGEVYFMGSASFHSLKFLEGMVVEFSPGAIITVETLIATGAVGNLIEFKSDYESIISQTSSSIGVGIGTSTDDIISQSFVPASSAELYRSLVYLRRVGTVTDYSIRCYIYDDNAGAPGSLIATATADKASATISTSYATASYFTFTGVLLEASKKYHIVLEQIGGTPGDVNYVYAYAYGGADDRYENGEGYYKSEGGSWTSMATGYGEDYVDLSFYVQARGQHNFYKTSGVVSCDYLSLSNSNAVGGAEWYAGSGSVDTSNNDGWIFGITYVGIQEIGLGGSDLLTLLNTFAISDIGSVNDLVNILGLIGKTDNATATESISILNSLTISETATGSDVIDLLLLLKELTLSEIGLGSDEVAIVVSALIELTENASGQDILYILNYISAHEIGSGIEDLDILEELNISDSAVGNEFIEMLNEFSIDDNAEAVDIIAKYLVKIYTKRNNPYGVKSNPYTKKTNPFSIKN